MITFMVVRQGVVLVVAGTLLGAFIAFAAAPRIEPLLFDAAARDPLVIGGVGVLLVAIALLASAVPAARAGRTNPLAALRAD